MNTKKKIAALILAVTCLFALVAGGTVAAVTEEGTTHNVITSSGVDIVLQEWQLVNGEEKPFPEKEGVTGVMPDTVQSKIVEVRNEDFAASAWVRVRVETTLTLANGKQDTEGLKYIQMDFDTEHWKEKDGYWYYQGKLDPDDVTPPLFTEVRFSKDMGNAYQQSVAQVKVYAEAVQSANNGTSAETATGWPKAPTT